MMISLGFGNFWLLAAVSLLLDNKALAEDVLYDWKIASRRSVPPLSPDCFTDRDMLLVNDQFPGPEIRANVGDTVHITWTNEHPSEGVSIHFHGLLMDNQPYSDGAGGVTTCIVGPMQTFTTTFLVDNSGTHYWHGHTSMDRMDGLQGAIVISDPDDPEEQALKELYDGEMVVFLQEWYHRSGPSMRTGLDSGVWIGSPQSILVNGKGMFSSCVDDPTLETCDPDGCTPERYLPSIGVVEEGKTYLLRIINAAGLVSMNFAIANHMMTVVRVEGRYVEPFSVSSLDINVAQRYSVLVTADQEPDTSYWVSSSAGRAAGLAHLQYGNSIMPDANSTLPVHTPQGLELDAMLFSVNTDDLPNSDILGPDVTPDRSIFAVGAQTLHVGSDKVLWTTNEVSNSLHSPKPLILLAYEAVMNETAVPWPGTDIPGTIVVPDLPPVTWDFSKTLQDANVSTVHDQHGIAVYKFNKGDVVEMVLQNTLSFSGRASNHAWHLHGHQLFVIGQGQGSFDRQRDPANFNLANPVLRDTVSVWPDTWTAVRFRANNVGVWPFHCTLVPHVIAGMGFNIITSPDKLSSPPPGLTSCFQTSVNPADAQVCMLESDVIDEDPIKEDGNTEGSDEDLSGDDDASSGEMMKANLGIFWLSLFLLLWTEN